MALINGDGGDNSLPGTSNDDTINGLGGNDTIDGGAGADLIDGGNGDDEIAGGSGADRLFGGDGRDYIDAGTGLNDTDQLSGGAGDDTLVGYGENDKLYGDDGNDTFIPLPGTVNGGDLLIDGGNSVTGDAIDLRQVLAQGFEIDLQTQNPDGNDNGIASYSGQIRLVNSTDGRSFNINYNDIEKIIPCFTPGTLIATPKGERRVEDLREGDRVITRDNGIQEIRWIGEKRLDRGELMRQPELKPVLIQAGSLGNGLPERDMLVSPNHRMLVANDKTALYFEEREVLVAAKHLIDTDGVDQVEALGVSYIHFMFQQHEVVLSDGTWSESFQPGDYSMKGIGDVQRAEILTLFPELENHEGIEGYQSARRTLKRHEVKLLQG
ncbi:intein N-terminal splicing region [Palleronia salina]|uniref:Intein N-terminal splicing region n=1 Tax=Palleronia salina TaxID=313368 RepID=A0A1M6AUR0_9RHOB|nr:Hint domain-containing protein [Palleronia salina]SHI40192.1 intein N-terminal splicing region [Palleronia salina]